MCTTTSSTIYFNVFFSLSLSLYEASSTTYKAEKKNNIKLQKKKKKRKKKATVNYHPMELLITQPFIKWKKHGQKKKRAVYVTLAETLLS